jgi:hypothetical protein
VTEVPKPVDVALDLFVYAPVGLALTAAEELPKLAAKGRTRVNTQITMARVVGQFALTRGRQELEKRFAGPPAGSSSASSFPSSPPPGTSSAGFSTVPAGSTVVAPEEPAQTFEEMTGNGSAPGASVNGSSASSPSRPGASRPGPVAATSSTTATAPSGPPPHPGDLAIPGYDSLSASQVVQRLAGLDGDELRAVAAYEQAHRGRRTILNRIDQLQGD